MKRKLPFITLFIVGISSILLILIQLQWMQSAIKTEKALLRMNTSTAVKNLNFYLERNELVDYFNKNPDQKFILKQIDSIRASFSTSLQTHSRIENLNIDHLKQEFRVYSKKENGSIRDEDIKKLLNNIILHSRNISGCEESALVPKEVEKYSAQLSQRSYLLNKFVNDMLNYNSFFPIEMRLNIDLLDSLIKQELFSNGVDTRTIYGVYKKGTGEFVFINDTNYRSKLLNSSYQYVLYPNDLINPKENILALFFPNDDQIVYRKNAWFIIFSISFVIFILFAFAYFLKIIINQKKLSELKDNFINNMTHEIKTPISTISLVSEILLDPQTQLNDAHTREYFNIIKDENNRLQNLVEQILQRVKLEESALVLKNEIIDIHNTIENTISNIKFMAIKKGGEIIQELDAKDSIINGDKMHITNIIYNLLDNACKYTPDKPKIEISTKNINNGIEISVKDNGIGIARNEYDKIFEKFYRVPTGNIHDVKGYGIGLSYVKQIVDLHGGNIRVESELRKGSRFIIFLPKQPLFSLQKK